MDEESPEAETKDRKKEEEVRDRRSLCVAFSPL